MNESNIKIKNELTHLLEELEEKKKELKDYLDLIDTKIHLIKNQLYTNIHNSKKTITNTDNKQKLDNWNKVKNEHEYDSDDSDDRLWLMDLPKFFSVDNK